ncbi:Hypp6827 [Branchiostoma lanceolatum]|uniref:Hypp6827 protein n=1 Tax=Branchiostoma lanceolatum TaxID=7740 RepID=A0A8K0E5Q1_BRALA|nr:Hypp6827 [Branchiostoma lanceolatum]
MNARLQLAVLDHNENVHREQATTKKGDLKWDAAWSKMATDWLSRRKYASKTFSFRDELMKAVLEKASVGNYRRGQYILPDPEVGGRNIAPVERPSTASLVERRKGSKEAEAAEEGGQVEGTKEGEATMEGEVTDAWQPEALSAMAEIGEGETRTRADADGPHALRPRVHHPRM